ncbi:hypothetical protein BZA05DRAFT_447872 [Tricharina praecox]|uniref:uncharacterized protein n=1 Tax=Tricharina praecox TaxID=43433 RepID=UPI00221EEC83|nr:uncharacterized protein BZA05DRAFT_447872 [Tricharina praecox]KAI5845539.1 hypothetical protein BZA05DRAFT_447872 [Tricharina praecox]
MSNDPETKRASTGNKMVDKKRPAVGTPMPTTGKKTRSGAPEATEWDLTPNEMHRFIPSEIRDYVGNAKSKDDFFNRMQVAFCCLFYRCHYYSEKMILAVVNELDPQVFQLSEDDNKKIGKRFEILLTEIASIHMRLTTYFVKETTRGKTLSKEVARCRAAKVKLPKLDPKEVLEALQLTPRTVRLLWMPIVPVVAEEEWGPSDAGEYMVYFRTLTGIFLARMARLFSERREQLTTHAQILLFSDNSHPKADREWPTWNLERSGLKHYVNGVFLTEVDRKKIDSYFSRQDKLVGAKRPQDADSEDAVDEVDKGSPVATATDLLGGSQNEVTGRPIYFGSEFRETGGVGMSKEVMGEVLSADQPHNNSLTGVLRDTIHRLETPEVEIAEIAALATVGVRGLTRYAMERILAESQIIVDAIHAGEGVLKANKDKLWELQLALAEQEKKAEWLREQQDKLRLSDAEVEEKNRELELMIKNRMR